MSRTTYSSVVIVAASDVDRQQTFNFVNLSSGSKIIQTAWLNGAVNDGVVILGIRTNSGSLGFIGGRSTIGPPPNDFNYTITSTNGADSSGINMLILPLRNQHSNISLTETAGLLSLRGLSPDINYGSAVLSGGTVTINTTAASSSNIIFCCNATTSLIGPNTPDPVGNVWISNFVPGVSFTISSTEPSASNPVFWFIVNIPQISGDGDVHANVILDSSATSSNNYGVITMAGGSASIHRPQVTPTSVVYVNTVIPDTNPGSRGYMLVAPDSTNGNIDFWSSNAADGQTFSWWLLETAGGVT